jgi:ElaB/YqjD/DUF883 family membrane-anchored ribosome-binding protein
MAGVMSTDSAKGPAGFDREFPALVPLIREEWPGIDGEALAQTKGDYDLVVALIAEQTEHTTALVKRQLDELRALAQGDCCGERSLRQVLSRWQSKSDEIASYVRNRMLAEAKAKVGENPLVSLLMAIGLGFILGFVLRGVGRDR